MKCWFVRSGRIARIVRLTVELWTLFVLEAQIAFGWGREETAWATLDDDDDG